ncbi:hypothetical protein [Paenibacillus sp. GP183]|jgi:hypothetical protein|uniref:hypothetical protein n=1 Tax=Paenibacillus sp. GP183 TaxID=1882751 RepID=UPI000895D8DB|nr:hypothetical protein [Paenibacillus sp. GP183]SEB48507.1 hypothetical protein SAMN05443246_0622 [Paenibacillus sp. GP183]
MSSHVNEMKRNVSIDAKKLYEKTHEKYNKSWRVFANGYMIEFSGNGERSLWNLYAV